MRSQVRSLSASRRYSGTGVEPPDRTRVAEPRSSSAIISRSLTRSSAVAAMLSLLTMVGGIRHLKRVAYWLHERQGQSFTADGGGDGVGQAAQAHAGGGSCRRPLRHSLPP